MRDKNDGSKSVVAAVQSAEMTAEILRKVMRELLQKEQSDQVGKTTLRKLSEQAGGHLDNIKISENNIGSFEETAENHNLQYALKRDNTTTPPTYFVFFKTENTDEMNRAFRDFLGQKDEPVLRKENIKTSANNRI